ncbi:MAG: ABC transporter permease [Defluviitaleaceae bacterium]|nr:ABC transporter permease [Defluviitaleaceae bacterium]
MNFFKRAITSISRTSTKSFILLGVVFILGIVISGATSVELAIRHTEMHLRQQMPALVSFSKDNHAEEMALQTSGLSWEEWFATHHHDTLTADLAREIGALPYVDHYEYAIQLEIESATLKDYQFGMESGDFLLGGRWSDSGMDWLQLQGTSESELLQVSQGVIEIIDGETFNEAHLQASSGISPAIVSTGFANLNDLSIGSMMTFHQYVLIPPPEGERWNDEWHHDPDNRFAEAVFEFEIIGIFDLVEAVSLYDTSDQGFLAQQRARNVMRPIHVPNDAIEAILNFQRTSWREMAAQLELDDGWNEDIRVSAVMLLHDPLDLELFREAAEKILPEFWYVEDLLHDFEAVAQSMSNIQEIARWMLWGTIASSLMVLSVLLMLFLYDRRHEIGVYLALGERKFKISLQILTETLLIAIVGITFSVAAGNLLAAFISRMLVRSEWSSMQVRHVSELDWNNPLNQMSLNAVVSIEETLEILRVSIGIETMGLFYLIGIGTVVLSTLIPLLYIVRFNPKSILN